MRSMLLAVLISLLSTLPVLAEEAPVDYPVSGLEFGLPSNLGLDDFGLEEVDGYDISWTRRTSKTRGWRAGMTIYLDHDSDDTAESLVYTDYWIFDDEESTSDVAHVLLRVQKLFVSEPRNGVSLVLGVGPAVGYEHSSYENRQAREYVPVDPEDQTYPEPTSSTTEQDGDRVWAGVAWDVGVEWRVASQVSVGARYQWFLSYGVLEQKTRYLYENGTESVTNTKNTYYDLSSGSVDLVATFWF